MLRSLAKKLRERTQELKEKSIDPYATSPEITPPVSKCAHMQPTRLQKANTQTQSKRYQTHRHPAALSACSAPVFKKEDYIRLKEEERIAKEEADKKKAEEAAKKAEEKKKKDEEKRLEAEKKAEEERLAEEARKKAKILPDISCSCFDVLFHPIEKMMDGYLGKTIDPLGEVLTGNTSAEVK